MPSNSTYDVVVIGAGLAGLAVSIRLRKQGKKVLVIEKRNKIGGKLDEYSWREFRWDKGPSLFTEPELIDDLFHLCNKTPRDYFHYLPLEESCRYFFENQSPVIFYKDQEKRNKSIQSIASVEEINQLDKYITESKSLYDSVGEFFLSNPIPKSSELFDKELLKRYPKFFKPQMRTSLNGFNQKRLRNQKLVKIFNRYGTYNGSNPYKMSGIYSMIPHLELNKGAFFPTEGMRSIVESVYQLALEEGVDFHFNENVKVKPTKSGYQVIGNTESSAPEVVCAIDHLTFYKDVLNDFSEYNKYVKQERSSSGLVFYLAVNKAFDQLDVHNIFFSDGYENEFKQIFNAQTLPEAPTFYVHISSKVNTEDAPKHGENWFVMVNTPAGITPKPEDIRRIRRQLDERIHQHTGIHLSEHVIHEEHWDSKSIASDTGSFMGALYGAASNNMLSALKRHGNASKKYPGLYFCGGTVHPGGGIPLVMRSAQLTANLMS